MLLDFFSAACSGPCVIAVYRAGFVGFSQLDNLFRVALKGIIGGEVSDLNVPYLRLGDIGEFRCACLHIGVRDTEIDLGIGAADISIIYVVLRVVEDLIDAYAGIEVFAVIAFRIIGTGPDIDALRIGGAAEHIIVAVPVRVVFLIIYIRSGHDPDMELLTLLNGLVNDLIAVSRELGGLYAYRLERGILNVHALVLVPDDAVDIICLGIVVRIRLKYTRGAAEIDVFGIVELLDPDACIALNVLLAPLGGNVDLLGLRSGNDGEFLVEFLHSELLAAVFAVARILSIHIVTGNQYVFSHIVAGQIIVFIRLPACGIYSRRISL